MPDSCFFCGGPADHDSGYCGGCLSELERQEEEFTYRQAWTDLEREWRWSRAAREIVTVGTGSEAPF